MKSKTAKNTDSFIKYINDLLNTLNSSSLYDKNPLRCALSKNNELQFLVLTKEYN